jgi:hypothetical protein
MTNPKESQMPKVARILSIDGGGIRGLIPATIINSWEKDLGPIAKKFHMIAGTSTGGILSTGLAQGVPAEKLVALYRDHGPAIFSSSILSLGGLAGQLYDAGPLEHAVDETIKGTLATLPKDLLITSYDIENRLPFLFKSWKARGLELTDGEIAANYDFKLKEVCRATSAAPTYFTPAKVKSKSGKEYALIDGGVFANNPAMCAYVAARRLYPDADEYLIVSIGTGSLTKPIHYDEAVEFGLVGWARPLLGIMFDGVSVTTQYELSQLPQVSQYRFETSLEEGSEAMDDVSAENLASLIGYGEKTVVKFEPDIARLKTFLNEPLTSLQELGYPTKSDEPKPVKTVTKAKKKKIVNQKSGALGGAAVGAVVGGPPGAIVGGLFGWIAGLFEENKEDKE